MQSPGFISTGASPIPDNSPVRLHRPESARRLCLPDEYASCYGIPAQRSHSFSFSFHTSFASLNAAHPFGHPT